MWKLNMLSQCMDHDFSSGDNANLTLLHPKLFTIQALEGVTAVGEEADIHQDIRWGFWEGQNKELVVKVVEEELQKGHSSSVHSVEWWERDGLLQIWGKSYVPNVPDL